MSQTRLFIGNLPENTNESDLQSAFSSYGQVINLDLKSKSADDSNKSKFAFVTISAPNANIESCIRDFSKEKFFGKSLYVTRARESFLERLQRERLEAKEKETKKEKTPKRHAIIKLGDKLNPKKRKVEIQESDVRHGPENKRKHNIPQVTVPEVSTSDGKNAKKQDSDKKRMESMKKKRQEFKEKQNIIKTGLIEIDKVQNKKIKFSDTEEVGDTNFENVTDNEPAKTAKVDKKVNLFDDEDSGDEVNFDIKQQYEGKEGQKVLDLQMRYKSDKRFVLDERFIEEEGTGEGDDQGDDNVEVAQIDEKTKQLNILQDVLGVTIKTNDSVHNNKKTKSKLGMLRFDPSQPEHAKFLAPVEERTEQPKKSKKKKKHEEEESSQVPEAPQVQGPAVEVSKEQFYKVSDTLKEAIAQPTTFSLRSLFSKNEEDDDPKSGAPLQQEESYIPLQAPKPPKVKNPLEPKEKNPFVYDSSDSEPEDKEEEKEIELPKTEVKAVWRENLFFTESDHRLKEGLEFFNKVKENEAHKERRELKSLMKKRIYNKERKNQMFQKKIGGKKKMIKNKFRKKR